MFVYIFVYTVLCTSWRELDSLDPCLSSTSWTEVNRHWSNGRPGGDIQWAIADRVILHHRELSIIDVSPRTNVSRVKSSRWHEKTWTARFLAPDIPNTSTFTFAKIFKTSIQRVLLFARNVASNRLNILSYKFHVTGNHCWAKNRQESKTGNFPLGQNRPRFPLIPAWRLMKEPPLLPPPLNDWHRSRGRFSN